MSFGDRWGEVVRLERICVASHISFSALSMILTVLASSCEDYMGMLVMLRLSYVDAE